MLIWSPDLKGYAMAILADAAKQERNIDVAARALRHPTAKQGPPQCHTTPGANDKPDEQDRASTAGIYTAGQCHVRKTPTKRLKDNSQSWHTPDGSIQSRALQSQKVERHATHSSPLFRYTVNGGRSSQKLELPSCRVPWGLRLP